MDYQSGRNQNPEDVAAELDALQAVGRALAHLRDPRARLRVLRWAAERFDEAPAARAGDRASAPAPVADPAVSVEDLNDLFDRPAHPATPEVVHYEIADERADDIIEVPPAKSGEPLDSLLKGLASDFQRFALEWQGA